MNKIKENKKNSIVIGVAVVLVLIFGFFFGRDILNNRDQIANVSESDLFESLEDNNSDEGSNDSESASDNDQSYSMTEVINGVTYFNKVRVPVLASPELFDYDGQKTQGCGDEIVWVTEDVEPTRAPLTASIEKMLDYNKDYGFEPANFLATQDQLSLDEVIIENRIAKIFLEGEFQIDSDCDLSRLFTQLEKTALQYGSVGGVQIFLNDELLR